MSCFKNYIMNVEAEADKLIREKSGDKNFIGYYDWHKGIANAYLSAIVETKAGLFCAQFWERRNILQIHTESQPGIFTPVCSITL